MNRGTAKELFIPEAKKYTQSRRKNGVELQHTQHEKIHYTVSLDTLFRFFLPFDHLGFFCNYLCSCHCWFAVAALNTDQSTEFQYDLRRMSVLFKGKWEIPSSSIFVGHSPSSIVFIHVYLLFLPLSMIAAGKLH